MYRSGFIGEMNIIGTENLREVIDDCYGADHYVVVGL